jgi:hypothetical protein
MSFGRRISTWLAGKKTFTPISTNNPPLILRSDGTGDDFAFLHRLHHALPIEDLLSLALAQSHHAVD